MNIDLEYAIKKDIQNNPVVREIDLQQKCEFNRMVWSATVIVGMLLFSAWQHLEIVNNGYQVCDARSRSSPTPSKHCACRRRLRPTPSSSSGRPRPLRPVRS